jgi:hypothetical protein
MIYDSRVRDDISEAMRERAEQRAAVHNLTVCDNCD